MGEMEAFVKEFIVESRENLDRFERDLVTLEKDPTSAETLAQIFRSIHTIKGAAGFVGLSNLAAVAHAGESLLSRLRDGSLVVTPEIASALLAMVDCLRRMIVTIDETGADDASAEGEADRTGVVERLTKLLSGSQSPRPGARASGDPTAPNNRPDAPAGTSLRVDIEHLDELVNLVGELVLARNEMLLLAAGEETSVLLGAALRVNGVTTKLQEAIMKARMQAIDNVWNKFPRMVRDLALQCGKQVRLDMQGSETELDKTLIEAIKDPLAHLLRNSIDHGLERPDQRVAAGKDVEGCLSLRAFHEGGQVNIEVSDDGTGIDLTAIKRKALERGLITPEGAGRIGEQETLNLIFLPGLSTAKSVTSLSGRGVGMDVVKTNIEQIGGTVSVHTRPRQGTMFRIKIPLTLAIMPAVIVSAAGERYAIPQVNLVELLRLEGDRARDVEVIQDVAVCRLRGQSLPLISLGTEMTAGSRSSEARRLERQEVLNIVVLQADDRRYGLIVDDVDDNQEIVVRPLGKRLRTIASFAGATILGDGRVALILDVLGLALHAAVLSEQRAPSSPKAEISPQEPSEDKQAFLLVAGSDDERMAIPLLQAARLEEFARSSLERSGNQDVVQYQGEILPLVSISHLLVERRRQARVTPELEPDQTVQTVVYSKGGARIGLVVNRILDTIEQTVVSPRPSGRKGVLGSMVIQGRVTEILDLDVICAGFAADPASTSALHEAVV